MCKCVCMWVFELTGALLIFITFSRRGRRVCYGAITWLLYLYLYYLDLWVYCFLFIWQSIKTYLDLIWNPKSLFWQYRNTQRSKEVEYDTDKIKMQIKMWETHGRGDFNDFLILLGWENYIILHGLDNYIICGEHKAAVTELPTSNPVASLLIVYY